jgi:hypothetical protein
VLFLLPGILSQYKHEEMVEIEGGGEIKFEG